MLGDQDSEKLCDIGNPGWNDFVDHVNRHWIEPLREGSITLNVGPRPGVNRYTNARALVVDALLSQPISKEIGGGNVESCLSFSDDSI